MFARISTRLLTDRRLSFPEVQRRQPCAGAGPRQRPDGDSAGQRPALAGTRQRRGCDQVLESFPRPSMRKYAGAWRFGAEQSAGDGVHQPALPVACIPAYHAPCLSSSSFPFVDERRARFFGRGIDHQGHGPHGSSWHHWPSGRHMRLRPGAFCNHPLRALR